MKKTLLFVIGIVVITLLVFGLAASLTGCQAEAEPPAEPQTLNMELVCVTPHGHQVYYYPHHTNGYTKEVYVIVRHADGMPLGISVTEN